MSYREPRFPLCMENPKLISLGWFPLQMVLCFGSFTIVNSSILLREPQWRWCHLPRKVSEGERGSGGISWEIATSLSTYATRSKDPSDSGHIMFLITTSGTPVSQPCPHVTWLGRIGIVSWWALCQNPEMSSCALLSISCWHWLCIYGELLA